MEAVAEVVAVAAPREVVLMEAVERLADKKVEHEVAEEVADEVVDRVV